MSSRYANTVFFRNNNPLYDEVFEDRGVKYINQYGTSEMTPLTPEQKKALTVETIIWQSGDRLEKIAGHHYQDPTYWWVIARYNQKPTDFHYQPGQAVYIPKPLSKILSFYVG